MLCLDTGSTCLDLCIVCVSSELKSIDKVCCFMEDVLSYIC